LTDFARPLDEGQAVRLIVEAITPQEESLELLFHMYDGLSEEEIDEIEKIILDRSRPWFPERDWSWLDHEDAEEDESAEPPSD
jgi:hypothetical protein